MRIAGIIPALWGSTRFPGKSLAMLGGKPVIRRVYERASAASRLDVVMVATDDDRIRQEVESFGGKCVMTRSDHPSGTDRAAEAVCGLDADIIVNIQGDEPFIESSLIDQLAAAMAVEIGWDMGTAAVPIDNERDLRDPSVVKVVWGRDHRAIYFSRSVIPFDRDHEYSVQSPLYWRHIGIYAYRKAFLQELVATPPCLLEKVEKLEQLRALHLGAGIKVIETKDVGVGIDTPADLARAEELMRSKGWL
ncbi:MAG: 3-deoxy-manno-octulosonate cytidylyltransferase [bacterium]